MSEELPVHPSAIEVAENGIGVVSDVGTRVGRITAPGVPSEPSNAEEKEEEGQKEDSKIPAPNPDPIPATLEVEAAYHIVTTPTDFALYRGELLMGAFPTLADAEATKKIAEAH